MSDKEVFVSGALLCVQRYTLKAPPAGRELICIYAPQIESKSVGNTEYSGKNQVSDHFH